VDRRPLLSGLELTLIGVVGVVLIGAALIGSNGDKATPDKSVAKTPRVKVGLIARRVEKLRGLRFRRRLKVQFLTPARATALIHAESSRDYSPQDQRVDEELLKLLGLISPSTDLGKVLRAIEDEQVLGFYDDHSKRLVVIRQRGDSRGLLEITLSHELTHALEDQRFGLQEKPGFTDDESAAQEALFEGTATALMTDYAEQYLKPRDLLGALSSVSRTETKLPGFIERTLLFPYMDGERFVTTFREGGSWAPINKVYELRRPRSTEQILHPELYALDERPVRVRVSDVTRRLESSWVRLRGGTIGELDLRLMVKQLGRVKGTAAAAGWGGGRFELWRRKTSGAPPCAAPCISRDVGVLRVAWDTMADRREGERALRRVVERGLEGKPLGGAASLWSSRGGAIGMIGGGRQTTFVLTPSAMLTVQLLARPARAKSGAPAR
jgi:hypothetical protein